MHLLGIDIGGTKTSVCTGSEDGTLHVARRIPSETARGFQDWAQRSFRLIDNVLEESELTLSDVDAIGMSAPGPLSVRRGTLLDAPNMTGWGEVPVVASFEEHLGRPIRMNNDANAAALAEWYYGDFKDTDSLIYLTMSTGLGAGIIANGHLLQGASDAAGEVGYHVLDPAGPESPCGHRGSFEAFCGGKNVADRLREHIQREDLQTCILDQAGGHPENIDFRTLVEAVREQDAYAMTVWDDYVEHLAQGIGNLMMIINPGAVLLGTIGIHAADILLEPLRRRIQPYVIPSVYTACTVVPSSLGSTIGDLAALALARQAAVANNA